MINFLQVSIDNKWMALADGNDIPSEFGKAAHENHILPGSVQYLYVSKAVNNSQWMRLLVQPGAPRYLADGFKMYQSPDGAVIGGVFGRETHIEMMLFIMQKKLQDLNQQYALMTTISQSHHEITKSIVSKIR